MLTTVGITGVGMLVLAGVGIIGDGTIGAGDGIPGDTILFGVRHITVDFTVTGVMATGTTEGTMLVIDITEEDILHTIQEEEAVITLQTRLDQEALAEAISIHQDVVVLQYAI